MLKKLLAAIKKAIKALGGGGPGWPPPPKAQDKPNDRWP